MIHLYCWIISSSLNKVTVFSSCLYTLQKPLQTFRSLLLESHSSQYVFCLNKNTQSLLSVCEQASLSLSSCPDIIAHLFQSVLIQSTMWEEIKKLSRGQTLRKKFQTLNLTPFINSNKIIYTEWSNNGQTWKHSEVRLGSAPRICLTKWIIILPSHVSPFWNTVTTLSLAASKHFFFFKGTL